MGVCHRRRCLLHKWKRKRNRLIFDLSIVSWWRCLCIHELFSDIFLWQMTALLVAFAWISTSDSAWKNKQTLKWLNQFNRIRKPQCHYLPDPKALLSMAAEILEGKDGDCAFTMCTYDWRHASALNPKNRMFPDPWSQKEEVHVSVTVWLSAEWVGCGVDFPLQPTGAQRTI